MAKSILAHCLQCGAEIKGRGRKYCSHACYWKSGNPLKGTHKPTTPRAECQNCGSLVIRKSSTRRDGRKSDVLYCNRNCYDEYRAKIVANRVKSCAGCGKVFQYVGEKKYCTDKCWRESQSPEAVECKGCGRLFCGVLFKDGIRYRRVRLTCSPECHLAWISNNPERKSKISAAFSGDKHPQWKGGLSLINRISGRGPNWKEQRERAIQRDGEACRTCGITREQHQEKYGGDLNVDHVVPYHNFNSFKKANRLSNLKTLCKSCHRREEAKKSFVQSVLPLVDGGGHCQLPRSVYCISNRKLSDDEVRTIRRLAENGCHAKEIASRYADKVGYSAVKSILDGKTWKNLLK